MRIIPNKSFKPLFENNTRYYLLCGGRGAGRSYSASQKAILDTISAPYSRIAVMRYVLGDVRGSIWQEVKDRLEEYDLPPVQADQMMHYEFDNNTIDGKGFRQSSSQNKAKLKSLAGYNTIIIEEADEVTEEDFDNLDTSVRTTKAENKIILMFNMPNKDHWIIKRWFNLIDSDIEGYYIPIAKDRADTTYMISDYSINRLNLTDSAVEVLEGHKKYNPDYYYTMVKGYVSEGRRGRIYRNWQPINSEEYENLAYSPQYGLDFGYTNDPTALVEVKKHNNNLYVRQLIYQTGLTNPDISNKLKTLKIEGVIIADSAEPKSIEELTRLGHNIIPSIKGADSIRAGIQKISQYQVHYTEDSIDLISEFQNYTYALDRDKNPTNKPIDEYNHLMDALRYSLSVEQSEYVIF